MKLLKESLFIEELDKLEATGSYKALVLNTVDQYNDLVRLYDPKESKQKNYMLYQLGCQLAKLMLDLKKFQKRTGKDEPEEDEFMKLMKEIKG